MNSNSDDYFEPQDAEAIRLKEVEARKASIQRSIEMHQGRLLNSKIWRSCLNCDYWGTRHKIVDATTINDRHCLLYNQMPPPEVIVNGCQNWEDEIPF